MNAEIDDVIAAFAHWRETRTKRGPIPPHLWEMAYHVSQKIGTFQASKLLKVNATRLKQLTGSKKVVEKAESVTFAELQIGPQKAPVQDEVILEVHGKYRTVKMTLRNIEEAGLLRLVQSLGDQR